MPVRACLLCLVISQLLACGQVPPLRPRVILPGEDVSGGFWLHAPKIAIVMIDKATWLKPDYAMTPGRLVLRLVAVDATVENVIQGELPEKPIRFYFFTNSVASGSVYPIVRTWFHPGSRYVVFLRDDGGILRTMADLTEPNIRIRSGRHNTLPLSLDDAPRRDPGAVIATAALTPSADHVEGFAEGMADTYGRLGLIVPDGYIARLLRALLANPDQATRERACLTLSFHYSYRDPCFSNLLDSKDPEVRQQASVLAPAKRASPQRLLSELSIAPDSINAPEFLDPLADELELFTFDLDFAVRRQACIAVHRIFPSRQFPQCKGMSVDKAELPAK